MVGWRLTSSMPAMVRSLSSCFEATRMWRRTEQISSPEFERTEYNLSKAATADQAWSTRRFLGVADEVAIEVARIAGHFAPEPRRRLDAFRNLPVTSTSATNSRLFVVAMEDIDVPGPAAKGFAISGLLDQSVDVRTVDRARSPHLILE